MKLIPLTQGRFAMVDDEDFDWLSGFTWCASRCGTNWYAGTNLVRPDGARRFARMHTLITKFAFTDHIDGDGFNNQRGNLRLASRTYNNRNTLSRTGASSRFKGVHWGRKVNRWVAQIRGGEGRAHLGVFRSEEEAALAYDAAARERYGPFATLNFPLPGERSAVTGQVVPHA